MKPKLAKANIFMLAFISSTLLVAGLLYLVAIFWPLLTAQVYNQPSYQPLLPVAEEKTDSYFDKKQEYLAAKQLYPALAETSEVAEGNWIRIPAINVNVPLVESPTMADKDILATLSSGAALYPNGVAPGRLGNTFISAHSTGEPWKGLYRYAFLRIDELEPGNLIHIDWQGTRYTYRITRDELIRPDPDFRLTSDRPVPTIAVMACWPLWTTQQRMLVHGELTNVTKLTPQPS